MDAAGVGTVELDGAGAGLAPGKTPAAAAGSPLEAAAAADVVTGGGASGGGEIPKSGFARGRFGATGTARATTGGRTGSVNATALSPGVAAGRTNLRGGALAAAGGGVVAAAAGGCTFEGVTAGAA